MHEQRTSTRTQSVSVILAQDFIAVDGVATGDPISYADELVLDDMYQMVNAARRHILTLETVEGGSDLKVAAISDVGRSGATIIIDSCITLMSEDSEAHEALVLVEIDQGGVSDVFIMPMSILQLEATFRLVGIDRHTATKRFAEIAFVSFSRGTLITTATGEPRLVEDLAVGDMVLTRDDGPQPIRWIGQVTHRATGSMAPVVIKKNAIYNVNDLTLSPEHRILIYQREDKLGAGRSEVLVKVRHLINGDTVIQKEGGFIDYFQLLFDDHQMIYAEGITAESLLIDPRTRAGVPEEMIPGQTGEHAHRSHLDYEIAESLISAPDAIELLKRASSD